MGYFYFLKTADASISATAAAETNAVQEPSVRFEQVFGRRSCFINQVTAAGLMPEQKERSLRVGLFTICVGGNCGD